MGKGYSCLLSMALTGIQAQAGWAQLCRERQLWDASSIFLVTWEEPPVVPCAFWCWWEEALAQS